MDGDGNLGLLDFLYHKQRAFYNLSRYWGLALLGIGICLLSFVYWYKENYSYYPNEVAYAVTYGLLGGIAIAFLAGGLIKLSGKMGP